MLPYSPDLHYAVRKLHMRIALGVLLIAAVAVGWELNNLHHPVQLEFCAEGPATSPPPISNEPAPGL
jgi:hypothetical protein